MLTEIGNGWYFFALDATDTDTLGILYYAITSATLGNDGQFSDNVVEMISGRLQVGVLALANNSITNLVFDTYAITQNAFADGAISSGKITDDARLSLFTVPVLPEAYPALGGAPTPAKALLALLQLATNISITGTTLTVFGLDGTTPIMTFTLNSATTPTSRTRAT